MTPSVAHGGMQEPDPAACPFFFSSVPKLRAMGAENNFNIFYKSFQNIRFPLLFFSPSNFFSLSIATCAKFLTYKNVIQYHHNQNVPVVTSSMSSIPCASPGNLLEAVEVEAARDTAQAVTPHSAVKCNLRIRQHHKDLSHGIKP